MVREKIERGEISGDPDKVSCGPRFVDKMLSRLEETEQEVIKSRKTSKLTLQRAEKVKPETFDHFYDVVVKRKYEELYAAGRISSPMPPPNTIHNYDEVGFDPNGRVRFVALYVSAWQRTLSQI